MLSLDIKLVVPGMVCSVVLVLWLNHAYVLVPAQMSTMSSLLVVLACLPCKQHTLHRQRRRRTCRWQSSHAAAALCCCLQLGGRSSQNGSWPRLHMAFGVSATTANRVFFWCDGKSC